MFIWIITKSNFFILLPQLKWFCIYELNFNGLVGEGNPKHFCKTNLYYWPHNRGGSVLLLKLSSLLSFCWFLLLMALFALNRLCLMIGRCTHYPPVEGPTVRLCTNTCAILKRNGRLTNTMTLISDIFLWNYYLRDCSVGQECCSGLRFSMEWGLSCGEGWVLWMSGKLVFIEINWNLLWNEYWKWTWWKCYLVIEPIDD